MLTVDELLKEVERLSNADKWTLFRRMIALLEKETHGVKTPGDYHEFLRQTYGSVSDPSFRRHDQGEYEEREPIE